MKVSRRWLEAFLRRPLDARDVAERLTMLGAPVDAITPIHPELRQVVIGLVEAVRPHPNADRLRLCTVRAGGATPLSVVCGASNVEAGRKYPFAPVGTSLPGGITLERRKIRGEYSEGMLCSARELGLGSDHEGILTLETEAEPGASFLAAMGLDDEELTIDTPPVRPDLLGHKGVARELAAAYRVTWRLPEIPGGRADGLAGGPSARPPARQGVVGGVEVRIEHGAACARFTGAVIRGVKVGPSPVWLRDRIEAVGLRSISNVVDATNYVMLELGQPLHAYDLARVPGPALIVRLSTGGEKVVTLDGIERQLPPGTTVVADAAGISGIGGVMGGRSSEVSAQTTDVFLESAWWHPAPLRRARRALSLTTDAAYRFERGTDLWAVPEALSRCIEVVLATAGGRLDGAALDLWPEPTQPPRIFLRQVRVAQVLGIALPGAEIERCLTAIGAMVLPKPDEARFAVQVPGWRPDLQQEVDLIEEIARIHGYQNFPDELRSFRAGNQVDAPITAAAGRVREGMVAEGLYEVTLLPLGDRGAGNGEWGMGGGNGGDQIRIVNPISADHGFLRNSLLPGLVRQVEANWTNQVRDVRLFEIGTVFLPGLPRGAVGGGGGGRPAEAMRVGAVLTGGRWPAHWTDGVGGRETPDCDAWELKGLFERGVSLANPGAVVQVEGEGWVARAGDGTVVGRAGLVQADAPRWAAPLFGFELTIDPASRPTARYARLPGLPAATRDVALLLPSGVTAAQVEALVHEAAGPAGNLLESVRVIDEYRGTGLPAGRRSVAFRLVLRASDRTLRDEEVDQVVGRVLKRLEQSLDVTARTS